MARICRKNFVDDLHRLVTISSTNYVLDPMAGIPKLLLIVHSLPRSLDSTSSEDFMRSIKALSA